MGEYEAPGYILTEAEFAIWTDAADEGMKTWLLMDRDTADALCPGAAEDRQTWQEGWSVTLRPLRIPITSSR